jgi:beta-lactamase regulating signal transducer with metallopeptidase domain
MLGWIAETTLVAAGIALVVLFAGRLLSNNPTVRHALWLVVLIKLITPPLVSWPWANQWLACDWPVTVSQAQSSTTGKVLVQADPSQPACGPTEPTLGRVVKQEQEIEPARPILDDKSANGQTVQQALVIVAASDQFSVWASPLPERAALVRFIVWTWLATSVVLAGAQTVRIIRFRRRLLAAIPAPDDLIDEAGWISRQLGISAPELLVVPDLGTPLLWCLGRPQLLLPARLVKTLPLDRWRGILAHELAHLRRGDHWVSRLELAAGLFWWWNPVYWLARTRLDAEAELACDAWVVWALPKDRLTYAEVLFDICTTFSMAKPPAPTLSVAGSGRFFERRLTMILRGDVPCRLTPAGLLGAFVLLFCTLPSWSAVPAIPDAVMTASLTSVSEVDQAATAADDDEKVIKKDKDVDSDNDEDGDRDDDDDAAARAKAKADAKSKKTDLDIDIDLSAIEKQIESKFGPGSDFEKKIEAFAKEIEARFGSDSDFEKKMEAFGKEIEAKFGSGSDFEKKMEAFGKEMEAKFGSGSDFEKKMEAFGKEMEAKFGSGSDFEKAMTNLGEEMKEKFGPGSEFVQKLKKQSGSDVDKKAQRKGSEKSPSLRAKPETGDDRAAVDAQKRKRERRIQELEAQIDKLVSEIKALKSGDSREKNDNE